MGSGVRCLGFYRAKKSIRNLLSKINVVLLTFSNNKNENEFFYIFGCIQNYKKPWKLPDICLALLQIISGIVKGMINKTLKSLCQNTIFLNNMHVYAHWWTSKTGQIRNTKAQYMFDVTNCDEARTIFGNYCCYFIIPTNIFHDFFSFYAISLTG